VTQRENAGVLKNLSFVPASVSKESAHQLGAGGRGKARGGWAFNSSMALANAAKCKARKHRTESQ